ncbi:MAG: isochorismatase family protein, partial [Bacteroidetes bacterium]|nr:isochorismatase family protein [Bacteroidota bacterium]
MNNLGILKRENTTLLVVDIQERLMPVIHNAEQIFANANRLIKGAEMLNVPIVVTEQYPKGLGNTCAEIELPELPAVFEKTCFSCMLSEPVLGQLEQLER